MRMTKRFLLLVLLVLMIPAAADAQTKTLLISETGVPYTEQSWFTYGEGSTIDQNDITSCWDQGKRIVTAAYTSDGWLVIMAKGTGYTMQTYLLSEEWPDRWIEEKTREGYAITSMSKSETQWLVVMSLGSGITSQVMWRNTWAELAPWMTEQKTKGYCVTDIAFDGEGWAVVMSQNSKFLSQGYFWASSTQELMNRVKNDVWNRGFNLHQVVYGEGNYVAVFGNYKRDDDRYQNLQISPNMVRDYIRQQWEKGVSIVYVGGGLPDKKVKKPRKSWIFR